MRAPKQTVARCTYIFRQSKAQIARHRDRLCVLRSCIMWRVVGVAVLAIGISCAGGSAADVIEGSATVTDGDTIRVGDTRIRLHGIDAPETSQTCNAAGGGAWACGAGGARAPP